MPIIKSAKKRVIQTKKRQARNYNVRTAVRKALRLITELVKAGDKKGAEAAMPNTYKVLDTAAKKNVMPKNTANRRKAKVAKMVSGMTGAKKAEAPAKKAAPKKKAAAKKPAAKKAPAKKAAPKKTTKKAE